ncbi:MAG TPA: DUF1565 domain-containing protein [Burkholderiales bacterium]|nr:DUF1565 domain-containing protein [Burkholderiales bacterium]
MNTFARTRIPVVILAALALAACPMDKKHHDDPPPVVSAPPPPSPTLFVNASTVGTDMGVDDINQPGTQAKPFKTITYAMTRATTSGTTVQVKPGVYDVPNGETFPITIPAGVLLIGDEANKGDLANNPTQILGSGPAPAGFVTQGVAVLPGAGSTIAGFTITHDSSAHSGDALLLINSNVTLRNNTVTGGSRAAVEFDAATNHVVTGNRIVSNSTGLFFSNGGVGSKVENNTITGNGTGIQYDVAGGDLGGGSASSVGGNVISCNTTFDLFVDAQTPITISAAKNFWDNVPQKFACTFTGDDICDFSTLVGAPFVAATFNTANSTQQPPPVCP